MSQTLAPKLSQIGVDPELHKELKTAAARAGKTLREFVTPTLAKLAAEKLSKPTA